MVTYCTHTYLMNAVMDMLRSEVDMKKRLEWVGTLVSHKSPLLPRIFPHTHCGLEEHGIRGQLEANMPVFVWFRTRDDRAARQGGESVELSISHSPSECFKSCACICPCHDEDSSRSVFSISFPENLHTCYNILHFFSSLNGVKHMTCLCTF